MTGAFTESVVEQGALAWIESVAWQVRNGAEIAPSEAAAGRDDYRQVVVTQRLRDTLLPTLISGALRIKDAVPLVGESA